MGIFLVVFLGNEVLVLDKKGKRGREMSQLC